MRKHLGAAIGIIALGFGGFTAAFADPGSPPPACDQSQGKAAEHNKHCGGSGGSPSGTGSDEHEHGDGDEGGGFLPALPPDGDLDGDGVGDDVDNCPITDNESQRDRDEDGFGNACDDVDDSDNDGFEDCPTTPAHDPQPDNDGDGLGDVCDPDDDGDGEPDAIEGHPTATEIAADAVDDAEGTVEATIDFARATAGI